MLCGIYHTCRRFQVIIDSDLFRQERAKPEWAQVEQVHVLTAEENFKKAAAEEDGEGPHYDLEGLPAIPSKCSELGYKHYYGAIQNEFRVIVDGKVGGTGSCTLIKRNVGSQSNSNFYALCDIVSQEVYDTATLFFDKQGRPRLPSLKVAMMKDAGTSRTGPQEKNDYLCTWPGSSYKLSIDHRSIPRGLQPRPSARFY
jgi:hypothetical protein